VVPGKLRPRGIRVAFLGDAPAIIVPGAKAEQEVEVEMYFRMNVLPPDLRAEVRKHLDSKLDSADGVQRAPLPKGKR